MLQTVKALEKNPNNNFLDRESSSASTKTAEKVLSYGFSRDEMNLAEFPLTVLSTRVNTNVKTLEFSDSFRLKTGELIERKWIITGADKFGLPTATDDDVVLGLMRLSMDQGFRNRKVYFTRYELLRALRWTTEGRSYGRLTKSLDRLSGVRIRASNAFYDNSQKAFQTRNFGLIDAYEINDERGKKSGGKASSRRKNLEENTERDAGSSRSYFVWSEVLFDSFKAGFIKKLDLDLYFSLQSSISRRLYRYLDKHFYYKPMIEKPLLQFAFEKLGLSRSYKYVSSVKQQLEPAAEELVRAGFLSHFEFDGKGEGCVVRFYAGNQPQVLGKREEKYNSRLPTRALNSNLPGSQVENQAEKFKDLNKVEDAFGSGFYGRKAHVAEQLVSRGLSSRQVRRLLQNKEDADIERIQQVVDYYDSLLEASDGNVLRNPLGFLYRAVENPARFISSKSGSQRTKIQVGSRAGNVSTIRPERKLFNSSENAPSNSSALVSITKQESLPLNSKVCPRNVLKAQAEYELYIKNALDQAKTALGQTKIAAIYHEMEARLRVLEKMLGEQKYKAALEKCVEDEISQMCGIPDFEAWQRSRKQN